MHHLLIALAIIGMFSGVLMPPAIFVSMPKAFRGKDEAEIE